MSVERESDPAPPGSRGMRAAHADRERAADVLKAAFAEGRLEQDEYIERVGQVHASRSYAELAVVTADLPAGPLGSLTSGPILVPVSAAVAAASPPVSALAVASLILGVAAVLVPAWFLVGVPAALLGLVAMLRIGPRRRGAWIALSGTLLGVFGYFGVIGMIGLHYS